MAVTSAAASPGPAARSGSAGTSVIGRMRPLSDSTRPMIAWGAVSVASSARRRRRRGAAPPGLPPYWASSSATVRCPWFSSGPLSRLIAPTVPRGRQSVQ
nr:hypothetical protein GCM10020241_40920 [Streptoalloteichus tenebrarius]